MPAFSFLLFKKRWETPAHCFVIMKKLSGHARLVFLIY